MRFNSPRHILTIAFLFALAAHHAPLGNAQNVAARVVDNPYLKSDVGDWVLMQRVLPLPSGPIKTQERRTVTSKDASRIVITYTSTDDGEEKEFSAQEIDLTKPFTTLTLLGYPSPGFPIRIVREGDESIAVGGALLKTHWTTYSLEARGRAKNQKQVWRCIDVPVGGLVKEIQTSSFGGPSRVTLVDFGFADSEKNKRKLASSDSGAAAAKPWTNPLGIKFQPIPSGGFTMGGMPRTDFIRRSVDLSLDDRLELLMQSPPHRSEIIQQPFFAAAHEVTIGQFRRFVEATSYVTDAEKDGKGGTGLSADGSWGPAPKFTWRQYGFLVTDQHAVANVSWNDANAFCRWLSKKEGHKYRLLTEPEWEYCCRANTETTFFTGDSAKSLDGYANMADRSLAAVTPRLPWALSHDDGYRYLAPVGQFKANAFGLHDMHGNLLEWCGSTFSALDPLPEVDAPEPPEIRYTLRGGHWFGDPKRAGAACRSGAEPSHRMSLIGFRVATDSKPVSNASQ